MVRSGSDQYNTRHAAATAANLAAAEVTWQPSLALCAQDLT